MGGRVHEGLLKPGDHDILVTYTGEAGVPTHMRIEMFSVVASYEYAECVDKTFCLTQLDDTNSPLLWSNIEQRKCLNGTSSSAECTKWKNCLNPESEESLQELLAAALVKSSALVETAVPTPHASQSSC